MYDVVGRTPAIIRHEGGIEVREPAVEGMIFHGVPIIPHEPPNVPRQRPLYSVANLTKQ